MKSDLEPLPVQQAALLPEQAAAQAWLVEPLWSHLAVGFIGGHPKIGKSWLALDLALSVASGTACLGAFPVRQKGPALVYLAEDPLPRVRARIAGLCANRALPLESLDLHVITAPTLLLDSHDDRCRLQQAIARLRPRLLVLDPLVRLHALDENSSADVSRLLGYLRALSRKYELAIVVVHHMSKKTRHLLGQALRGSSDLHAWSDSSAYLTRGKGQILLTLEHRSAPAPEPIPLILTSGPGGPNTHLERASSPAAGEAAAPSLADRICSLLAASAAPLSRIALREKLRINNARLGGLLEALEHDGRLRRTAAGWLLAHAAQGPDQASAATAPSAASQRRERRTDQPQLALPL